MHGIDCNCEKCEKIRKLIRDGVNSGNIFLVASDEEKEKIMKDRR